MAFHLKPRWVLLLVLIVFIACKIPHLYYPYYWDESWPYGTAIQEMYRHGISLMPNAIDAEISRGHPLFFHSIAAIWMHIFGSSHFAMHSFALFISVLFLIAIYEVGLRLFNQRVAVTSILIVATQVVFFVQSSFVLFEMLVAFLAFLSIYFYVKDKYVLTILCLTALFYTKESGLIVGFVIGLDAVVGLFNKQIATKTRLWRIVSIAIPCALIGIYFIIQKHVRGWYIFPLYNELIEHSWQSFWYKFRMSCIRGAFYENLKFYYFIVLMALSIIAAVKNKSLKYLAFLIPAIIIYYFVDDMRAGRILPSIPFFILFVLSVFYFLYVFSNSKFYVKTEQRRFIVLTGLFILCFLCFSTMNFFTYRYLIVAIIPLLFLTAVFYDMLITHSFKALYYLLLAIILLIGFFSFKFNDGYGDADLGAFDAMDMQQNIAGYMSSNNYYNNCIGGGLFLTNQSLVNADAGYTKDSKSFKTVRSEIDRNTEFAIFDNISPDSRYNDIKRDTSFLLVYTYVNKKKRKIWAEIYQRK